MGCGPSTPESSTANLSEKTEKQQHDHQKTSVQNTQTEQLKNERNGSQKQPKRSDIPNNKITVQKPVAFDVELDTTPNGKAPPKKLQLDPIENAPKLTAEMLEEKLRAADEKRAQKLENIRETSRKSTKLRSRILDAQQFEEQRHNEINNEITEKQRSADLKKELRRKEMEEKKRLRDERAKRVREKAKEMRGEADLEFEVEKDEHFNNDEEDSWLADGGDLTRENSDIGERIYSGRESPAKRHRPMGSADQRARILNSASTSDSFDYAFQRIPKKTSNDEEHDDFFD